VYSLSKSGIQDLRRRYRGATTTSAVARNATAKGYLGWREIMLRNAQARELPRLGSRKAQCVKMLAGEKTLEIFA
jgi:hypothetical protein